MDLPTRKKIPTKGTFVFILILLTWIYPGAAQSQNQPEIIKLRHFVFRANPLRIVQNAILNRSSERNFPEFNGLSLEVSPIKLLTFEFEPGFAKLSSLDHIIFETGWGINGIGTNHSWSPTGNVTARIYPFTNSQDKPKASFEGFWVGFMAGFGSWKFNSLNFFYRDHEPDPNTGNEYTYRYYLHSNGNISRTAFFGSIGNNFTLDKNGRWNLSTYLNIGTFRYSINSDFETVSTPFGPPEVFNNPHFVKTHLAIQAGAGLGYIF